MKTLPPGLYCIVFLSFALPVQAESTFAGGTKFVVNAIEYYSSHTRFLISQSFERPAWQGRMTQWPCDELVIDLNNTHSLDPDNLLEQRHREAIQYLDIALKNERPIAVRGLRYKGSCTMKVAGIDYMDEPPGNVFASIVFQPEAPPAVVEDAPGPDLIYNQTRFPNGSVASVKWHLKDEGPEFNIKTPVGTDYFRLRELAQSGEAWAAFHLSRLLADCNRTYEDEEDLEEAIKHARETFIVRTATDAMQLRGPKEVESSITISLIEPFEKCRGLTRQQKNEADGWLREAADGGVALAMIKLGIALSGKDNAAEIYLDNAWAAGDAYALMALAAHYRNEHFAGRDGDPPGNEVRGLAAHYAYLRVLELSDKVGNRSARINVEAHQQHIAAGILAISASWDPLPAFEQTHGRVAEPQITHRLC